MICFDEYHRVVWCRNVKKKKKKRNAIAVAIRLKVKPQSKISSLHETFVNVRPGKHFYNIKKCFKSHFDLDV